MIDQARLDELRSEIGSEDLAEVIEMFCEEVEEALQNLETLPADRLVDQLHFLKGSALNIGLRSVSDLCRAEELRLRDSPGLRPDVGSIRSAYAHTKPALLDSL